MAKIGYARVSTTDQNADLQQDELDRAGCERTFVDHAPGALASRPELEAALAYLRPGDTLVVWRLDRLGRSLRHLVEVVAELESKEIAFQSLKESIDTSTPAGRLVFHVFASLAEFERDLIRERTKAGLEAARARGRKGGRKPVLSADQIAVVRRMHADGQHSVAAIADVVGVSRATVYRHLQSASG